MAWTTLIAPTTSAVAVKADFDATPYETVLVATDALATTETAVVWVKVGTAYQPAGNLAGTAAGTSATVGSVALPGGTWYAVTKAATAGACGVYWSPVLTRG